MYSTDLTRIFRPKRSFGPADWAEISTQFVVEEVVTECEITLFTYLDSGAGIRVLFGLRRFGLKAGAPCNCLLIDGILAFENTLAIFMRLFGYGTVTLIPFTGCPKIIGTDFWDSRIV